MRCLLAWLVALTASHALTWSGQTHGGHGRSDAALEPHLSAASFDHGHIDCGSVRVDAAVLTGAFRVQRPPFQLERWFFSAARNLPRSSERWPESHAPPA